MKLITLLENESNHANLLSAHGFSLLIEYQDKTILFDLGPNNYYQDNAAELGFDLKEVDLVVISHGHYDHAFDIEGFLQINKKAKVYVSKYAFETYVSQKVLKHMIGIKKPTSMERVVLVEHDVELYPGVKLITEVIYHKNVLSDVRMKVQRAGQFVEDDFRHELYLTLTEGESNVLITGCSHKGIEEIIKQIERKEHTMFTHIMGGFHFKNYNPDHDQETVYLKELGKRLHLNSQACYYSCHCTGHLAESILKEELGEKFHEIHTGSILEI